MTKNVYLDSSHSTKGNTLTLLKKSPSLEGSTSDLDADKVLATKSRFRLDTRMTPRHFLVFLGALDHGFIHTVVLRRSNGVGHNFRI